MLRHYQSLFLTSGSWHPKGLPGWSFSAAWSSRCSEASLAGVFSIALCVRHQKAWLTGVLLYCFGTRHLKDHCLWDLSLLVSCQCCWGEKSYSEVSIPCAWFSSITSSPWLPGFPPKAFPTKIFSLTSPQAVSQQSTPDLPLGLLSHPYAPAPSCFTFQGTCIPAQGTEGCSKDCLCGSRSIQTVTDQLLYSPTVSNASPLSQTVTPIWGSDPCFGFPTAQVQQGQSCSPSLLFFSPRLSYQVLRGSMYSFLVIRVSCLLSAGVLQDLLHLKMYSWCIHGERCAPRPPTPAPSWLLSAKYFKILFSTFLINSPNITF